MTDEECPYSGCCPHIKRIEEVITRDEERLERTDDELRTLITRMSKTLYIIVGILMMELGVTIA